MITGATVAAHMHAHTLTHTQTHTHTADFQGDTATGFTSDNNDEADR